nr:3234_t:CDS:2 [Entrophospora candida]
MNFLRLRNDFLSSQNKFFYKLNYFSLQNLSKKKNFSNNSLKISELSLPYFDYSKLQKKNSSFSIDEDFILFPNHLNESEQSFLVEKSSKKLKRAFGKEVIYQDAHFDDVIHGYRECQATHWSTGTATNGKDEEEDKYSGRIVAGISLISSTVMIFRHKDDPEIQFSVLLEPGSLYVQRDSIRYNFTHEIPQDPNEHRFKGQLIPKKPTKLAKDAYKASEEARYTKKICLSLSDRLEAGSRALEDLYRHREENIDVFVNSEFFKNLQRYVNAATEIKRFIDEISELSGAMKYINAKSRKEKVEQLITRNGKREDLKNYNHFHDIQRSWLQEPTLRPDMHTFLTQLANLHKRYCSPRIIPHDKSQNSNNTVCELCGLNTRPSDLQSDALPTELNSQIT